MIQQLKSSKTPSLLWQGNDGFIFSDGQYMIATDLDLAAGNRIFPPTVDMDELAENLDLLLITHEHGDHFNAPTVGQLLKKDRCHFIIPESCRSKALSIPGLAERTTFCKPGDHIRRGDMTIECIRALHGHFLGSIYSGASLLDCGYRFQFAGQWFYEPGDTVLLEEHFQMPPVDVLFVSPTEHNMGVENALRFIRLIRPGKIILQHHSTYREEPDNLFWTHGFLQELLAALTEEELKKCIIPDPGVIIRL